MMREIGSELHHATSALALGTADGEHPIILDLCMAPGGFAASVLDFNRDATVCGISLPASQGGHHMLLPDRKSRTQVQFLDITMLAVEMDVTEVPLEHPDAANFLPDRPFYNERFDLIFCDGQVLRGHPRPEYREKREASRLLTSQLVLAMQRIKKDGRLVILLHKLDAWDTISLVHTLSKFSSLQLFKPVKKHAIRSSFYVVAGNVQPDNAYFRAALAAWKDEWRIATFGSEVEYQEFRTPCVSDVSNVLQSFGTELIRMGESVWKIQSAALRKSSFVG
jgi:hypothetical protein